MRIDGSKAVCLKSIFLLTVTFAMFGCTQDSMKEFFCESTDNAGGVNFYKQQVVQLSDRQMCILWPSNTPICVQTNKPLQTTWQENQQTQFKHQEKLELEIIRESAIVQILQSQKSMTSPTANASPFSPLVKYEFKKKPEVLTVFTSAVDKDPRIFSCKPWVKREWWQIY